VDTPAAAAGQFAHDPQAVDAQRKDDPNLDHDASLHELFEDQLSAADLVVLSKADLVTPGQLAQVRAMVAEEVPAEVKMIEAVQGSVPLSVLLGQQRAAELHIDARHSNHDHDEDHDHDAFDSLHIDLGAVDRDRLMQALQAIVQKHAVLRVKGFVALPGKKMRLLVQGVGRRFDAYFDRAWREDEKAATRLVFIGKGLNAEVLQQELVHAEA
ncbi:MAG: GTP-binding protein, partial [Comamonas sp.]|nr:GTP-binding protein [Comamonas sp.]